MMRVMFGSDGDSGDLPVEDSEAIAIQELVDSAPLIRYIVLQMQRKRAIQ